MSANVIAILPSRKGRPFTDDGRRLCAMYPRGYGREHWIYAMGFVGGVIKIGRTYRPRTRYAEHWHTVKGNVTWLHLFAPMGNEAARLTELGVPKALAGIADRINGSEWFYANDKAEVIARVRVVIDGAKRVEAKLKEGSARHKRAWELLEEAERAEVAAQATPQPEEAAQ